jgi:Aminoglycoside-2''-adenylyltransferase
MPAIGLPSPESWGVLTPHDAADLLSAARLPWWIAGGWALDLFLGKGTRAHKDLDIGIFRKDAAIVLAGVGSSLKRGMVRLLNLLRTMYPAQRLIRCGANGQTERIGNLS